MTNDEMSVKEWFDRDVADHVMDVRLNHGIYRHLVFAKPGTNAYRFEVSTIPGYLIVTGDMGAWTFSRIPDMFEFFRNSKGTINPQYWSEKLVAVNSASAHKMGGRPGYEFDDAAFNLRVTERFNQHFKDDEDSSNDDEALIKENQCNDCWNQLKDDVLTEEGYFNKVSAANSFYHRLTGFRLDVDLADLIAVRPEFHFLWCCHAIVHAIQAFDQRLVKIKEPSS